ncbi:outer membrane protein TolC [Anseongella ginsenosidimutans]|uniref:Outer membrane protein TolC n=1 Tax=Anseongella ginsenosidimutans TaxID=496056 RepID=A0A4R3KS11_9SPHI|nr:TolC family protein [Anseongella ginsenosidimutans]QEC52560.1 TolC family protein [Anseongella ginsenosidimutans]TCS86475.1 outer membrane protein TolC [Anseongella ginsenosidimutans]
MQSINYRSSCGALIILLLCFSQALQAQQVLTLENILDSIRSNNPLLESYEYRINAEHAYAEGAKSWMAPMVGAGTFMTPYPGSEIMNEGDKGMFMVGAEQSIPNPARLKARENYLESKAAITAAGQSGTYNQLRAQAKGLYYQWMVLEKKKAVLEESRQIMQTMLKLARIRYPYSQGSLGSIYKAEGRLEETENLILMTNSQIIKKNIILNALMNIPDSVRYHIDLGEPDVDPLLASVDSAYLVQNRSDLLGVERSIESKQLGLELEKMERKPGFSIRFEHMMPYGSMMPNQYTLMGMISIPIAPWSSRMYKSNIKGMQLEIQAMEKEREAMLKRMQGMIRGMTRDIRIMQQQLRNYTEKILPALKKNYEVTLLSYEQSQEELSLVINAWETLNMAQMEYLDKLEAYYLMVVEYEKEIEQ